MDAAAERRAAMLVDTPTTVPETRPPLDTLSAHRMNTFQFPGSPASSLFELSDASCHDGQDASSTAITGLSAADGIENRVPYPREPRRMSETHAAYARRRWPQGTPTKPQTRADAPTGSPSRVSGRPASIIECPLTPVSIAESTQSSVSLLETAQVLLGETQEVVRQPGRPQDRPHGLGMGLGIDTPSMPPPAPFAPSAPSSVTSSACSPSSERTRGHRRHLSRIAAPIGEIPERTDEANSWGSFSNNSPMMSPQISEIPAFGSRAPAGSAPPSRPASGEQQWTSLQEILNLLAQKERQVLEAQQALTDAQDGLAAFRARVDRMLGPVPSPLAIPTRPKIIIPHHQPNLGINALSYTRDSDSPCTMNPWALEDAPQERHLSLSLRIVQCLLDMVHCIIKTFPTHQAHSERVWRPAYPSPTQTLYAYMAYEL